VRILFTRRRGKSMRSQNLKPFTEDTEGKERAQREATEERE
jgi:hypothetical protein